MGEGLLAMRHTPAVVLNKVWPRFIFNIVLRLRAFVLLCGWLPGIAWSAEPEVATSPLPDNTEQVSREAFLTALAHAPMVAAARARLSAARHDGAAAGVLPDPRLGLGVGLETMRSGGSSPMYGALLEQPLPRWGERDAQRMTATSQIRLAEAELAEALGDQAAVLATALAEARAWRATIELRHASEKRIQVLKDVLHGQLASGAAPLGAALALDTRAQELTLQITEAERQVADAEAEARGRLAIAPTEPLPPVAFPHLASIDMGATPLALRALATRSAAEADERGAESRGNPETSVGVGWDREQAGTTDQNDKFRLSFTMSLPVHRAAYEATAEAARARARAASHEVDGSRWMARSLIERATRAQAQAARSRSAADAVSDRTRTEMDAITQQVGLAQPAAGGSLIQAIDVLDRITAAQQQVIDAELTSALALADLWRLAPPVVPTKADVPDAEHPVTPSASPTDSPANSPAMKAEK